MKFLKKKVFFLLLFLVITLFGYNLSRALYVIYELPIKDLHIAKEGDVNFTITQKITSIKVFRGLPNSSWSTNEFWKTVFFSRKKQIRGHLFYAESIDASRLDLRAINEIICNPANFRPFSGEKMAGPNQASLYLGWTNDSGDMYEIVSSDSTEEFYIYVNGHGKRYDYSRELSRNIQIPLSDYVIPIKNN